MFSYEERMTAVNLYIASNYHLGTVMCELGYPSPVALRQWHKEYIETGTLKQVITHKPRFSQEEIKTAVDHYFQHGQSYTGTSRTLGYPNRNTLAQWVLVSGKRLSANCTKQTSVLKCSNKEQQEAVLLWVSGVPDYKVAAQYGVCAATIYTWRKKFLGKDMAMERKRIKSNSRGPIATTTIPIESPVIDVDESELEHLRASIAQIQTEKVQLKKEVANL